MTSHLKSLIEKAEGFEWDEWNAKKIWEKHHASTKEIEEIFFDTQLVLQDDDTHSDVETRYIAIGRTVQGRLLFVPFTLRNKRIRPISARDVSKEKEVTLYEKAA